jgi:hypothetical protein
MPPDPLLVHGRDRDAEAMRHLPAGPEDRHLARSNVSRYLFTRHGNDARQGSGDGDE